MYSPSIPEAPILELRRLRQALFLLVAEIEIHALGAILAFSALLFSMPIIGLGKDELLMFLWVAAQIGAASTLAGMVGRFGCRTVGAWKFVYGAVALDMVVFLIGLVAITGLVPTWVVFWAELPRLISFVLTLGYLTELALGASDNEIAELLRQTAKALLWQLGLWPAVIFTTLGACFGAVAFACIVLPLIPLGLICLGVFLFVRVIVNYSFAVRKLRAVVTRRINELEEGIVPSSSANSLQ
jgi:hypothetical protein